MAVNVAKQYARYLPRNNAFYKRYTHIVLYTIMGLCVLLLIVIGLSFYQFLNKPVPKFTAVQSDGKRMELTSFPDPNLLPDTILRWGSKAATLSYNFDFQNFNAQLQLPRPYFTEAGWQDFLRSVQNLINTIVANQLFVNGVVSGTPVISNQGPLPGRGYVWRVQIPFLVTFQSANGTSQTSYYVVLTIVRVPTNINPQGIGIDQFVMVSTR